MESPLIFNFIVDLSVFLSLHHGYLVFEHRNAMTVHGSTKFPSNEAGKVNFLINDIFYPIHSSKKLGCVRLRMITETVSKE